MSALKLPNGAQTHPWIQTFQWLTNPLEYMEDCAKFYGDIFTLQLGQNFAPQVFVSNPQAIQQIFTTEFPRWTGIFIFIVSREQRHLKLFPTLPTYDPKLVKYARLVTSLTTTTRN